MFKTYVGMAPKIMYEIFPRNYALNYNLRRYPEFASRAVDRIHYGSESLSFLGSFLLPVDLKSSDSLDSFKLEIKKLATTGMSL